MPWTAADDARLKVLASETHLAGAAREMGRRVENVWSRAYHLKIRALPRKVSWQPTDGEWIGVARAVAQDAQIEPALILGGSKLKRPVRARWKAWRKLLADYPEYSIAGLARTSGYHHTTILSGLRRLSKIECDDASL